MTRLCRSIKQLGKEESGVAILNASFLGRETLICELAPPDFFLVNMTLCFKAKGEPNFNTIPDWLSVEFSLDAKPRFYSVWVVPWIAEPAIALRTLDLDGSVEAWIAHIESLGFEDVVQVSCFEFFGPVS